MHKPKRKIWRYVILALIFIGTFLQYQHRAPRRHFSDFHVPYSIGKRFLAGQEIYSYDIGLSYFKYPPFYANLAASLSVMPERVAANVWYILSFIFVMVLFHVSRKIIAKDDESDPFLLYALTFWVMFRFLLQNMHEGQANVFMITLLTLGLYFYQQNKIKSSAFFIAYSIMTKYMTMFFLPFFILLKEVRLMIFVGIFILFFNFFPTLGFGLSKNILLIKQQLAFLFDSSIDPVSLTTNANQSLWGFIGRLFWKDSIYQVHIFQWERQTVFMIVYVLMAVFYLLTLLPLHRKNSHLSNEQKHWRMIIDWAMIFICMALFNPNAWMNFFVCLTFSYMTVLYYLILKKGKDILILILLILSFALSSWTSEEVVQWFAGDYFEIFSSVTLGTFLLFAALFILKIRNLNGNLLKDKGRVPN